MVGPRIYKEVTVIFHHWLLSIYVYNFKCLAHSTDRKNPKIYQKGWLLVDNVTGISIFE